MIKVYGKSKRQRERGRWKKRKKKTGDGYREISWEGREREREREGRSDNLARVPIQRTWLTLRRKSQEPRQKCPPAVATIFCLIAIAGGKAASSQRPGRHQIGKGLDTARFSFLPLLFYGSLVSMLIYRRVKFSHPVFDTA